MADPAAPKYENGDLVQKFHEHADGSFTIESVQDVGPYLEANRAEMNEYNGRGRQLVGDRMWKLATIPNVVIEKWMREYGVNIFDPNHEEAVMRLLRDPDNRDLRTRPGKI